MAILLPEEVTMEILTRLPPESLCRSKSVCKSWYALINSFQYKHLLLQRLVMTSSGNKKLIYSILKFPLTIARSVSVLDVDFPLTRPLVLTGHSHGLVCLTDVRDIFLFNPTTRELRKLPPSILLLTEFSPDPDGDPDGYDSFSSGVGFGYDAKSRDFKVVSVVGFAEDGFFYPARVEMYDLSKDRWREIENTIYEHGGIFGIPSFDMYHEGTYYWWGRRGEYPINIDIIQTFDMSEEVFAEILLPESFSLHPEKSKSMGVLNGFIVVFLYPHKLNEKPFDIWEMDIWKMEKDECGVVSWSKLLSIGPISGIQIHKPLGFVSSDELLMVLRESGQLISYNIKTQHIKELPIKGDPESFEATFFVESFLSVESGSNNISHQF